MLYFLQRERDPPMVQPKPRPEPDVTPQTRLVRSLRGGQITIPIEFRRALGIGPDAMLQITREGDEPRLTPIRGTGPHRDATWFKDVIELFAPIRAEAVERGYSEDEINGWIDDAVAAARAERADGD